MNIRLILVFLIGIILLLGGSVFAFTFEQGNVTKYNVVSNDASEKDIDFRGLVGWWKLEDNNGTFFNDSSGMNNFGICIDCPAQTFEGIVGGAYDFDGVNDYLNISDDDSLSFTDGSDNDEPFSISGWANMNDATDFNIANKGRINTESWEYWLYSDNSDKLIFTTIDDSVPAQVGRKYNTIITSLQGQWIHVVGTYDGSEISSGFKLYLNGVRVDDIDEESGSYAGMENTDSPFRIGRTQTSYSNGSIDEVKIWNRTLSQNEITNLFNRTKNIYTAHDIAVSVVNSTENPNNSSVNYVFDWRKENVSIAVLNFPFNENGSSTNWTTVTDYSSYVSDVYYNGSVETMPRWNRTGGFDGNGAYSFDGLDDSLSKLVSDFRSEDDVGSVSLWFKREKVGVTGTLFSSSDTVTATSYLMFRISSADNLRVLARNAGDPADIVRGNTNLLDNTWHHAVLISNGTSWKIYLDGQEESLVPQIGSNTGDWFADITLRDNIGIGGFLTTSFVSIFNGSIDQVQVFNRTLTVAQIQEMYADGQGGYNRIVSEETNTYDSWRVFITMLDSYLGKVGFETTIIDVVDRISCTYFNFEWNIDGWDSCTINTDTDIQGYEFTVEGNSSGTNLITGADVYDARKCVVKNSKLTIKNGTLRIKGGL